MGPVHVLSFVFGLGNLFEGVVHQLRIGEAMDAVVSGDELNKTGAGAFLDATAFIVAASSHLRAVARPAGWQEKLGDIRIAARSLCLFQSPP